MIEKEKLVAMVRKLQEGDPDGAAQLYETFRDDIYYFILKTVNNDRELAEDLTQDTFVEILETVGKLQEPAAFVTWSKQIAYHRCTAYFRKRKELLADEDEDGYSVFETVEEENEEFIPDAALEKEDLKNTIAAMINELPEEQKSALVLRYFNEISVKDIAQIQGVTEGTVKSRLNYGRKAIKQSVEDYEKKSGVKLRCVGIVPLLLWLFRQYRLAGGISLTAQTAETVSFAAGGAAASASAAASAVSASAGTSASASSAASAAAKTGIKIGSKVISQKVIAGVAAAVIAVGGTTAGILSQPGEGSNQLVNGSAFAEMVPEEVAHIAIVDVEIPAGVKKIDVSADGKKGVVAWVEEEIMYVAAKNGEKVLANEDCSYMFYNCGKIETIDLSNLDTSQTTNMASMFLGSTVTTLDLSGFDMSNVTDISAMFGESDIASIDCSGWDTSSVTNMSATFAVCTSLEYLDLSGWDTSNVTTMCSMFGECWNLKEIGLENWDTSNVISMEGMFGRCRSLTTLDLSRWDTSKVQDMSYMFEECENLITLDLSSFDIGNVLLFEFDPEFPWSGFDFMFMNCRNLKTIYATDWTESSSVPASVVEGMFCNTYSLFGTAAYADSGNEGFEMANTDGYFTQK